MVGPLLFGVILLAIALADGAPWWIWAGIPGCLAVSGIFLWRYGPRRLLDREPALVIDEHGICDRVKGIEVAWDEIERLVPWEQVAGSATRGSAATCV